MDPIVQAFSGCMLVFVRVSMLAIGLLLVEVAFAGVLRKDVTHGTNGTQHGSRFSADRACSRTLPSWGNTPCAWWLNNVVASTGGLISKRTCGSVRYTQSMAYTTKYEQLWCHVCSQQNRYCKTNHIYYQTLRYLIWIKYETIVSGPTPPPILLGIKNGWPTGNLTIFPGKYLGLFAPVWNRDLDETRLG